MRAWTKPLARYESTTSRRIYPEPGPPTGMKGPRVQTSYVRYSYYDAYATMRQYSQISAIDPRATTSVYRSGRANDSMTHQRRAANPRGAAQKAKGAVAAENAPQISFSTPQQTASAIVGPYSEGTGSKTASSKVAA